MKRISKTKGLGWIAVAALVLLWQQFGPGLPTDTSLGDGGIAELYAQKQSNTMVEFEGRVDRILADDNDGSRHQRFILKLDNGHTVLAYSAGKMSKHKIRVLVGDRVSVELSPYDLSRGRITYRHKTTSGPTG